MIEVQFWTEDSQKVRAIHITGHAGLGSKGSDVLCAAVSALTYTLRDGIQEILNQETRSSQEEGDFFLELKSEANAGTELLFATVLHTLNKLSKQYTDRLRIRRIEDGA